MHVVRNLGAAGTELVVRKVVAGLDPELFDQVILMVTDYVVEPYPQARVITLGHRLKGRDGFLLPEFMRVFARERPHVVHSRNWSTIEAVPAARLAAVPAVIHSEHGRNLDTLHGEPWRRRAFRRLCYRLADRVFAVSGELKQHYVTRLGISASRFEVIPNGVDAQHFRPDPEARKERRKRLGVGEDTLVVGCVNRFDPIKDHATLLRGAELALSRGVDLLVVLVGDGPERSRLERELEVRRGLRNRVVLTGLVNNVAAWLNAFDVFVLPSLSEGMSNTLLEAMAVGLPPVATRVGGNPEVIEADRSGLLFDPRDAEMLATHLNRLAQQIELRRMIGASARERVERCFSVRTMLERYSRLYTEVFERNAAVQPALSQA